MSSKLQRIAQGGDDRLKIRHARRECPNQKRLKLQHTWSTILLTPCLTTFDAEAAVAKFTQGSSSSNVVFAGI